MYDINGLAYALEKKAAWRREKAEKHPDDVRNLGAAEMLDSLASQVSDIDPELQHSLNAFEGDAEFEERGSDILTDIGFHRHYVKIDDLVRDLVAPK